jgi:hypothetical protein
MKITFKKGAKPTGLFSVGHPFADTIIKIDGKEVGYITAPSWESQTHQWGFSFSVMKIEPDDSPDCNWKNIILKLHVDTEALARDMVPDIVEKLSKKYTFHPLE